LRFQQRRSGSFYSCKWEYPKIGIFEGIFIVLLLLNHHCSPNSLSGENNYSEEVPDEPWSSKRVFRLYINSNEKQSYPPNLSIKQNAGKTEEKTNGLESSSSHIKHTLWNTTSSNLTSSGVDLTTRSEESREEREDSYSYHFENDNPLLEIFPNGFPLPVPTTRTGISHSSNQGWTQVMGSESSVKHTRPPPFKTGQQEPEIFPASHIDATHAHNQKPYKPRRKIQKRRKQHQEPLHRFPPISSIKQPKPIYSTDLMNNRKNVSLKATFLTPETEEISSSIELELSVNGDPSNPNHGTSIQIATPENPCLQILDRNRKRTLLNVWSFSNGKLKLESQREVPPSIFNGSKLVDGELLNRDEIPQPVSNELSALLTGIGRTDNVTVLSNFHLPASGENFFGGNRRRNVILLHYILWGQREKAWRVMLDKTVESYLRNYFMSTFSTARSNRANGQLREK